jgi:hypothetical protein
MPGREWVFHGTATGQGRVAASPLLPATVDDYLPAGFAFSCLGFLFFLSFFWEWLPLPMADFLAMYVTHWTRNRRGV